MEYSMPDLATVRTFLRPRCDASIALERLEATYIQAGAQGPARVLYEAPAANGGVLRLAARRVAPAKGRRIEASINARSSPFQPRTGFRQPAIYAPALELLFQVFPADEKLESLPLAVDASAMTATLQAVLRGETRAQLKQVAVHVMRYKPERKCLLRYDLTWSGDEAAHHPKVVWARVARRSKFERTRDTLRRLYAHADAIGLDLPRPLGAADGLDMEFFGPVAGVVLFSLVHRDDFPSLCRRIGEGLGRFHGLPVTVDEVFDIAAQLERLNENAVEFAWMLPAGRNRILTLERELAGRLQASNRSTLHLIHRDFHGDNILVSDEGRIALLDFEDCAMGEPADDVGANWAQLTWHAHKARAASAGANAARDAFIDGYLETAADATVAHLATYSAMHCFLYAYQCLRHLRDAARHEDALAMLAACEDVLARGLR